MASDYGQSACGGLAEGAIIDTVAEGRGNPFAGHELRSPDVSEDEALAIAEGLFGIAGEAHSAGSHQDQNFIIEAGGKRFVLKVANQAFERAELEAQNAALLHLAQEDVGFEIPQPLPARDGELIATVANARDTYLVRLLTFVEGRPLSEARYLAPPVLAAAGALAAGCASGLAGFTHPGASRLIQWDLRQARQLVDALAPALSNRRRAEMAKRVAAQAAEQIAPLEDDLRVGVIHSDVTDHNSITMPDDSGRPIPMGLIDFGDLVRSWLAAEAAITITSLMAHDLQRPLQTAVEVLRAFHSRLPLTEPEVEALWPLVQARAASGAIGNEHQLELEPDNAYVRRATESEWLLLARVSEIPAALAHEVFRDALGLGASRSVRAAQDALTNVVVRPITDFADRVEELDFSVTSTELARGNWEGRGQVHSLVEAAASRAIPIGRYGEERLIHSQRQSSGEPSTVHLGVDVFLPEGSAISSPIDATIVRADARELLLEAHAPDAFQLRLAGIEPSASASDEVSTGTVIGTVAEPRERLLPSHVHLQAIAALGLDAPGLAQASLANAWRSLCPDPSPLLGLDPPPKSTKLGDPAQLLDRRRRVLAPAQEHYYAAPPEIERGWQECLYDTTGRAYLDMINNVAVLGHSHPAVEEAVSRQLQLLNSNSRFLYEAMVDYAERLVALLPGSLDTVFFVSTGSEANDLALRLVRAATNERDVLSLEGAYHGWTSASDEVSTYLIDNPDALSTRPAWVHPVESPNTYRGPYRGEDAGKHYAAAIEPILDRLRSANRGLAGFICEPVNGNGGGVLFPHQYLQDVYRLVREAGGFCIADEVQVGLGRLGHWFWGFEQQRVVPDVVTLAKPAGNGIPIAAVITSSEIASAFRRRASFFSSVGGAPVACSAGLAVLNTLEAERLQGNARDVGAHLKSRLIELVDRHAICGTVHGAGLFQGLELIRNPEELEPAAEEAQAICERMLELGVIVQPTGEHGNVLKLKPPLCISRDGVDFFVDCLERVLNDGW